MSSGEETQGPHPPGLPETIRESAAEREPGHDRADRPAANRAGGAPAAGGVASYHEFAGALIEIGLIDAGELERFAAGSSEEVLELSRALVKAGRLTPYQAAAVYQKKSRGLLIGDYFILDKVGQGGMGMVFKARHRTLGRLGALKILPPSFARDRGAVMRFRREFEAAGRLNHLNLVAAFEANEDRGVHFLVMDFVEGRNLDRIVGEQGPLPVPLAVDYMIQAARGLEAAHEKGIVHRDIKPGNLIIDRDGTVRVLDLGLARIVDATNPFSKSVSGRLTQSGTYMGTIDYMAPEQAEDAHLVDHRADIYSLGCTFFFLLTGREPFSGGTIFKRMVAHQEQAAPSLRAVRPEVPRVLEAAYQAMMAKKPDERPASMTAVIELLQATKLATDDIGEEVATAPKARAESPTSNPVRPRPARPAPSDVDSFIFVRGAGGDGTLADHDLNLRDLVMDVRPDVGVPALPRAGGDVSQPARVEREPNFFDLASELRAEAPSPATPRPSSAPAQPLKRSGATKPEDAPSPVAKPSSSQPAPLKRTPPPRHEPVAESDATPWSAEIQPLKRSATPRPESAPPTPPKRDSAEVEKPLQPALSPEAPRSRITSKSPAILAVAAVILLILTIVTFLSLQPARPPETENPSPVSDEDLTEVPSTEAP